MDFEEMDEMWHKIREELAAEDEGLSVEERLARDREFWEEACKKYGLKKIRADRRGRD